MSKQTNNNKKFDKNLIGLMMFILFLGIIIGQTAASYKCIVMLQQQEKDFEYDK